MLLFDATFDEAQLRRPTNEILLADKRFLNDEGGFPQNSRKYGQVSH